MDTGKGNMELLEKKQFKRLVKADPEKAESCFSIGEEVILKNSIFRIVKITKKKLTLRIQPKYKART